jgi:hypothetical protein
MLYSYSVQIQKELPWQLVTILAYQGSVGHHFMRLVNQNFLYPTCAPLNPDGSCAANSKSAPFSASYIPTPDVYTNYNGINATLNKRFAHGYSLNATYTYSKSMDQLSNEGPGALSNQTDPAHPITEYGPSDFDNRHRFVVAGNWTIPSWKDHGFATRATTGWQINGIFQYHTGFPWTPVTGQPSVAAVTSAATIAPTRPLAYYGGAHNSCSNSAYIHGSNFPNGGKSYFLIGHPGPPGIGRNSWNGPCYLNTDISLDKETSFSIRDHDAAVIFQANFYNAFNKTNLQPILFGTANATIENTLFGISPGSDAGRVIDFFVRINF